jgi:hypothetical protein
MTCRQNEPWIQLSLFEIARAILPVNVGVEINLYCLLNEIGHVMGFYGEEVSVGL